MTEPDFWNDNIAAQKISLELSDLKLKYDNFKKMQELCEDSELLQEMLDEDASLQSY